LLAVPSCAILSVRGFDGFAAERKEHHEGYGRTGYDLLKDGPSAIEKILADYDKRYGERPYIKDKLRIAQI